MHYLQNNKRQSRKKILLTNWYLVIPRKKNLKVRERFSNLWTASCIHVLQKCAHCIKTSVDDMWEIFQIILSFCDLFNQPFMHSHTLQFARYDAMRDFRFRSPINKAGKTKEHSDKVRVCVYKLYKKKKYDN
jgi:hypothetical protein